MTDPDKTQARRPPERGKDSQGRIGTVMAGRYRILQLLGEGAQGSVYVGEHLRIGRKDAIKILQPALLDDEDAVARFRRGASKASHINHPNVCTVYDFGETEEGLPFMASELVDGRELHDVLRTDAPMKLDRSVDLLEQIAAGLTAAHDLNIVHRDLKPANVMLTRGRGGREVVKVVDFDIAKGIGEAESGGGLTQAGWIIGTPQYMSPEQITASDIDARSDIYSLALIFFEMLTGQLPNEVGSTQKLMWQRVSGDLKKLSQALPSGRFPIGLQEALDRALAKDPADRPESAIEFAREVREAVRNPPVASEDEMETAVAPAPDLAETQVAEPGAMPPTAAAPDGPPAAVPPTRPAPEQTPGPAGEQIPATRVADPTPDPDHGERPSWASVPVVAGVAGVAVMAVVAGAWATGLIGGGGPAVLANMPDAPLALDVGGAPLLLNEVRLESADGEAIRGASLTFESRDPSIARTDGYQISAASAGDTWVVVSGGDVIDSVQVTVAERVVGNRPDSSEAERVDIPPDDPPERATGGPDTRGEDAESQEIDSDEPETPPVTEEQVLEMYRDVILADAIDALTAQEQRAFRRDAEAAFEQRDLPASVRARAAYVMAKYHTPGSADYCTWARRALALQPTYDAFQQLGRSCQDRP